MSQETPKVAILYQAVPPPVFDGVVKPAKPGGYSDSGADIGFELKNQGITVVTPVENPNPKENFDWVFPDTEEGINSAIEKGANLLWANTILFSQHPLNTMKLPDYLKFVGQEPVMCEKGDDKARTNDELRKRGLTLPKAWIFESSKDLNITEEDLPIVLKPIRGRGSHGVAMVKTMEEFKAHCAALFAESAAILAEQYLSGEEITVTVLPPGDYDIVGKKDKHWSLPIITRFNHVDGIAPYSGKIAVTVNSRVITDEEHNSDPHYQEIFRECAEVGHILDAYAPLRVDARRYKDGGKFALFDVNMKPNATGPGRPGRDDQLSLTGMSAEKIGWNYGTFLLNVLKQAKNVVAVRRGLKF